MRDRQELRNALLDSAKALAGLKYDSQGAGIAKWLEARRELNLLDLESCSNNEMLWKLRGISEVIQEIQKLVE